VELTARQKLAWRKVGQAEVSRQGEKEIVEKEQTARSGLCAANEPLPVYAIFISQTSIFSPGLIFHAGFFTALERKARESGTTVETICRFQRWRSVAAELGRTFFASSC